MERVKIFNSNHSRQKNIYVFSLRELKRKNGEKYSIFLHLKRSVKKYKEKQFKIKYISLFYLDAIKTEDDERFVRY